MSTPPVSIHRLVVWEDSTFSLMARVLGSNASNITQSTVAAVRYSVFDLSNPNVAHQSGNLTVGSVVFNSLQTDARWDADSTGYNFRWDVPDTVISTGGKRYRIEIIIEQSGGGGDIPLVFEAKAQNLLRS